MEAATETFPWGERRPDGGYKVGDEVGIIHSDHDDYLFDNPHGVVTAVEEDEDGCQVVTVQVEAEVVGDDLLYLIERDGKSHTYQEEVNA